MTTEQPDLSFVLTLEGELVITFPDGLHYNTHLFPNSHECVVLKDLFESTIGRTLIMQLRTREIHDHLTNLLLQAPARSIIHHKLRGLHAKGFEGVISVLLVDLDHFGQVNKQHGQIAGDDVLKWISGILGRSVREGDIVSRWGGDEFLIYAPASKPKEKEHHALRDRDSKPTMLEERVSTGTTLNDMQSLFGYGKLIAERIHSSAEKKPCNADGTIIQQTATIGVANAFIYPGANTEGLLETLLRLASDELYKAKRKESRAGTFIAQMIQIKPEVF